MVETIPVADSGNSNISKATILLHLKTYTRKVHLFVWNVKILLFINYICVNNFFTLLTLTLNTVIIEDGYDMANEMIEKHARTDEEQEVIHVMENPYYGLESASEECDDKMQVIQAIQNPYYGLESDSEESEEMQMIQVIQM